MSKPLITMQYIRDHVDMHTNEVLVPRADLEYLVRCRDKLEIQELSDEDIREMIRVMDAQAVPMPHSLCVGGIVYSRNKETGRFESEDGYYLKWDDNE